MRPLLFLAILELQLFHSCILFAEPMIPLALAEPAVEAAKKEWPDNADMRRVFISSYCEAFLDAWRYGRRADNIGITKRYRSGFVGYETGMQAKLKELKNTRITPADFGYKTVSIEGTYKSTFEISEFIEGVTGERYYVNLGDVEVLPQGKVRLLAWVSPEASLLMGHERLVGFGHMGRCKLELIVIHVENQK